MKNNNLQTDQHYFNAAISQFNLNESGNSGIDTLSRVLSVKTAFFNYFQFINFAFITKSSKILPGRHKEYPTTIKEEKLWLFPNPAGDYVITYYDLDLKYKTGEIRLIDLKGNLLKSQSIRSGKDQLVLDLKDYPIGFYLISLNSRNQVIESKKLSKGRN